MLATSCFALVTYIRVKTPKRSSPKAVFSAERQFLGTKRTRSGTKNEFFVTTAEPTSDETNPMPFEAPIPTRAERDDLRLTAGLCAACRHLQIVRSKRSRFVRCALSEQDPAFPRYPPLPRLDCGGFKAAADPPPDPR